MRLWITPLLAATIALLSSCAAVRESPYVLSVSGVVSSAEGPRSGARVELVGLSIIGKSGESVADPVRRFKEASAHRAVTTTDEWGRYDLTLARFDHRFAFAWFPPFGGWLTPAPHFAALIKLDDTRGQILRVFSRGDGSLRFTAYDSGGAVLPKSEAAARMLSVTFGTQRKWSGLPIQGHAHVEFEIGPEGAPAAHEAPEAEQPPEPVQSPDAEESTLGEDPPEPVDTPADPSVALPVAEDLPEPVDSSRIEEPSAPEAN